MTTYGWSTLVWRKLERKMFNAIDFWLQRYNLLYSERGVVFGAGYTDVHAQFVATWVMAIAAVVIND